MLKRKGLAVGSSRNNTGSKAPERRHAQVVQGVSAWELFWPTGNAVRRGFISSCLLLRATGKVS